MKRRQWWLVLILLLAAGLRFFQLDARSLWFDEALSILIGRLSVSQILEGTCSQHPPAYYLLLHAWGIVGEGDWFSRYPSVFASLLSVALTYQVGRLVFDHRVGLLGACGMAISPFQIYYAQEARMYTLLIMSSLGVLWFCARGVLNPRSKSAWGGYILFGILGLYSHYYVAWVLMAFHLWLLIFWRRSCATWRSLLVADFVIGLAFLPRLGQFFQDTGRFVSVAKLMSPSPLAPLITLEYLLFGHLVSERWWGVRVAVLLLLLAWVILEWVRGRRQSRRRWMGLLLLIAGLPMVAVLIVSWLVRPIYIDRSFAMIAPFLILFLAKGVADAPRRSPTLWTGILLGALMLVGVVSAFAQPDIAKPPVREAIGVIAQDFREGDISVHLDETYLSAVAYAPDLSPVLLNAGQYIWKSPPGRCPFGSYVVTSDEALAAEGRLWLVITDRSRQPWEGFLERVRQERQEDGVWDWSNLTLYRYR